MFLTWLDWYDDLPFARQVAEIIDPAQGVQIALENAVSVSGTLLTKRASRRFRNRPPNGGSPLS